MSDDFACALDYKCIEVRCFSVPKLRIFNCEANLCALLCVKKCFAIIKLSYNALVSLEVDFLVIKSFDLKIL